MKSKTIVTWILLLFVGLSVVYLIAKEVRNNGGTPKQTDNQADEAGSARTMGASATRSDTGQANKVVAYYFHGNVRCQTCRTIEAYAEEAIKNGYPEQLASGKVEWHAVNIEQPENEHFVQDYSLVTRSVVLVRMKDGAQAEWKRLDKVWNLVHTKQAFVDYIYESADPMIESVH